MGVRLKGPAKFLIILIALGLIYIGLSYLEVTKKIFGTKTQTQTDSSGKNILRVGIVTWGGYAGGLVANGGFETKSGSIYDELGIKVKFIVIDDFEKCRAAFRSGEIDIMWGTVDSFALEYPKLKTLQPVVILQNDWSRGGDAIAVIQSIKTAEDLRGKSIAVAEGTPSHFFALFVLTEAGLSKDDVRWVFTKSAVDAANAFKSGSVDACVSWAPDVYIAARSRSGAKILASTKTATNLIADILISKKDFVDKNIDSITKFVKGWFKGVEKVKANPDEAIQLMITKPGENGFSGVDYNLSKEMLQNVYLPGYSENIQFFTRESTGRNYFTLFKDAERLWNILGSIKETNDPYQTLIPSIFNTIASDFSTTERREIFTFNPISNEELESKAKVLRKKISIYFPSGSANLDMNAKLLLMQEARSLLDTFANAYIRVSGNTDNTGSREINISMSKMRAESVVNFLVEKLKIPRERFVVIGNGPDKPVASNDTEEGRQLNRRTDFEVFSR